MTCALSSARRPAMTRARFWMPRRHGAAVATVFVLFVFAAAFARAESDREAYLSRKPDLRLEIADFRRLTPLRDRTELARAAALVSDSLSRMRSASQSAQVAMACW